MRCVRGGGPADTEAIEVEPVAGHVLLGLEHDNMDLGSKHTAQDHKPAQTHRDAHGGGLNLRSREDGAVISSQTVMDTSYANVVQSNCF